MEPESDSLTDIYDRAVERYTKLTASLPPLQTLILRSIALAAVVVTSFAAVCICWSSMYKAIVPKEGRVGQVWLQYGHSRPPFAEVPLSPVGFYLSSDQQYDVTLDFVVPATVRNMHVGNFMVTLALIGSDGRTLVNVSRPASLAYRSPISLTIAALSPLAFFRSPDTQHLSVPLVASEILQRRSSTPVLAMIEIGRRDAHAHDERWNGGGGEVQVYSAKLRFDAHLSGIRWLLYHYPITSFLLFTPLFLIIELFSALAIWAFITYRSPLLFTSLPSSTASSTNSEDGGSDGDFKREIKVESTFEERDREQDRLAAERAKEARLRSGIRMGEGTETTVLGDVLPSLGGGGAAEEEATDTGEGEEGSSESVTSWEGIEPVGAVQIKEEEFDDTATVGGSTTTRASTTLSFGPSLASTRASTSTELS